MNERFCYDWHVYGDDNYAIAVHLVTGETHDFTPTSDYNSAFARAVSWTFPGI